MTTKKVFYCEECGFNTNNVFTFDGSIPATLIFNGKCDLINYKIDECRMDEDFDDLEVNCDNCCSEASILEISLEDYNKINDNCDFNIFFNVDNKLKIKNVYIDKELVFDTLDELINYYI